jgi:preprotein translocase SecE subunit
MGISCATGEEHMEWLKKIKLYFAEVWGEVKPREGRVSWPSQDEIWGSTWVVVVTVAILGLYLGLLDLGVGYVMTWILGV